MTILLILLVLISFCSGALFNIAISLYTLRSPEWKIRALQSAIGLGISLTTIFAIMNDVP